MERSLNLQDLTNALKTAADARDADIIEYTEGLRLLRLRNMFSDAWGLGYYASTFTEDKQLNTDSLNKLVQEKINSFKKFIEAKIEFARILQNLEQQLQVIAKLLSDITSEFRIKFHIDAVLKKDSKTSKPQRRDIKIQPDTLIESIVEIFNPAVLEQRDLVKAFEFIKTFRDFDKIIKGIKQREKTARAKLEEVHQEYIRKRLPFLTGKHYLDMKEKDSLFCIIGLPDKDCPDPDAKSIIDRAIESGKKYSEVWQGLQVKFRKHYHLQAKDYYLDNISIHAPDQMKLDVNSLVVNKINQLLIELLDECIKDVKYPDKYKWTNRLVNKMLNEEAERKALPPNNT